MGATTGEDNRHERVPTDLSLKERKDLRSRLQPFRMRYLAAASGKIPEPPKWANGVGEWERATLRSIAEAMKRQRLSANGLRQMLKEGDGLTRIRAADFLLALKIQKWHVDGTFNAYESALELLTSKPILDPSSAEKLRMQAGVAADRTASSVPELASDREWWVATPGMQIQYERALQQLARPAASEIAIRLREQVFGSPSEPDPGTAGVGLKESKELIEALHNLRHKDPAQPAYAVYRAVRELVGDRVRMSDQARRSVERCALQLLVLFLTELHVAFHLEPSDRSSPNRLFVLASPIESDGPDANPLTAAIVAEGSHLGGELRLEYVPVSGDGRADTVDLPDYVSIHEHGILPGDEATALRSEIANAASGVRQRIVNALFANQLGSQNLVRHAPPVLSDAQLAQDLEIAREGGHAFIRIFVDMRKPGGVDLIGLASETAQRLCVEVVARGEQGEPPPGFKFAGMIRPGRGALDRLIVRTMNVLHILKFN